MLSLTLLWLLLVSAATGESQLAVGQLQQAPTQPRTIAGVVINSVTGRPISRALVQAGQHAMFTDGEGRFEFREVTDWYAVPVAIKPGYFAENVGGMVPGVPPVDGHAGPVEVRLVPEAILSGRMTDARGTPLEGITVQLRTLTVSNGLKHWSQRAETPTNAEGEFRFAELQAGEYALQTILKLDGPPEGEAAAGYAPVEYPALGANGAGALQLHAGSHLEAEISTRLEKLFPVAGVINGAPGTGVSFTVRTADGMERNPASRMNPETGEFRILAPSGSFELRAHAYTPPTPDSAGHGIISDPGRQLIARHLVTVAQGPVSGMSMTLEPTAVFAVEVAEEKIAKSQAGGQTPPSPDPSQLNINLWPAEAEAAQMMYSAQRVGNRADPVHGAQGGGPLLIRNLPPGQYFLQAQSQPPWYVASAFCGGTDLTRERLSITGSAAGCTLRLVLRDDAASLRVSLSDANGSRPAFTFVYLVPLNNLTRDVQRFPTGADGKFAMDGIPPGQYLLLATRHDEQLAYRDAESLRRYETVGKRVDLTPGGSAEVQLDVMAGEP